jgi:hypothetical protein
MGSKSLSLVFCGLCAFTPLGWAQSTTDGALGGIITDPSSAAIPGATVTARNLATNATATSQTDINGRYIIIHLQPGVYDLEATAKGLATVKRSQITVEVGRTTTVDLSLSLQQTTETVSVTGEAPVVTTDQQDFSINLNQTSVNNLPINGRRWFNFALMTPGTVTDGGFGDISFRGISGLLNNNTVDGGDNNQAFFSEEKGRTRIAYSTSQESIQEFQVNTSSYSAEYGRAAGGVINAVTKSGSNEFHGGVFYFNRDQSFGAFTPFAVRPALVNGSYTSVAVKPRDIRHQMGGDVGGYILKDKLFFYFNYDQQIRHFPAVATPSSPAVLFGGLSSSEMTTLTNRLGAGTAANLSTAQITANAQQVFTLWGALSGTAARDGNQKLFFPKIDWRPTTNNSVTLSWNRMHWTSPYGIQTNSVVNRGLDSFGDDFVKDDTAVARWTSIITPAVTNELRFQYGRDFEFEFANPSLALDPHAATGFAPDTSITGATTFEWGQPYYTQRFKYPDERRVQVADTASVARGKHLIKFGIDFNHVNDQIQFLNTGGGEYYYNNRVDYISDYIASQFPSVLTATKGMVCGTATSPLQCYNEYQQGFGPLGFTFSTMEYSAFVQDQWRVSSRLTVNLGMRYEFETMPAPQIPNPAVPATGVLNSDRRDFGPRVGFAWDVTGHGKTSVRGGYGIYYGRIINGTIFQAISSTGVANAQVQATIFPSSNGNIGPIYPNVVSALTGTVAKPNIVIFPGNLRNPMVQEYDLVLEHEIAPNTVISLSWLGSLGHFLPVSVDTNLPAPTSITYNVSGGPLAGQAVTVPFYKGTRPNPVFNQIILISTRISSTYNAGVLQFTRRMTRGLQFQTSYTLSDSRDDGQGTSPTLSSSTPASPANLAFDRGPSNFDVRHRAAVSLVWQPPYFDQASNRGVRWLLSGWTIAPIFVAASGLPFTPTTSGNPPSGLGNAGSGILGAQQATTRVPFLERNAYRYPGTNNMDLRIARNFKLRERARLELIGEAFNLYNHFNATSVTTLMYTVGGTAAAPAVTYNPNFGTITNANNNNVLGPRQIQLGAKVTF